MATSQIERQQAKAAMIFAFAGLIVVAVVVLWIYSAGMKEAKDITAIAAIFTGLIGTVVGLALGYNAGSSGKEAMRTDQASAEARAQIAENKAHMSYMMLPPDKRQEVMDEMNR